MECIYGYRLLLLLLLVFRGCARRKSARRGTIGAMTQRWTTSCLRGEDELASERSVLTSDKSAACAHVWCMGLRRWDSWTRLGEREREIGPRDLGIVMGLWSCCVVSRKNNCSAELGVEWVARGFFSLSIRMLLVHARDEAAKHFNCTKR